MALNDSFRQNRFNSPSLFLILSVIFGTDSEAKKAWQSVKTEVKEDSLSSENYRVFSLLVSRLCQLSIEDETIPKLKGLSRYFWVKNQIKVKTIEALIKQLQSNEIKNILLKKFGLLLFLYQDSLKLPVSNVAFLVNSQDVIKTVEVLKKEGWEPKGFICETLLTDFNFTRLENKNVSQDLRIIEIYWRVESQYSYALIPSEYLFKQQLNIIEFGDHPVNVFNATYQLYYLLSILEDNINLTSWSVNFITLLRNHHHVIDWNELSEQLQKNNLHITLKQIDFKIFLKALDPFHQNEQFLKTLDSIPINLSNKIELWLKKYKNAHPFFARLDYRYKKYTKTDIYQQNTSKLQGFLIYLKQEWSINSYWELPLQMLTRSSQYLSKFVKG